MEDHPPVQYYVPTQIILRGQRSEVEKVVDELQTIYAFRLSEIRTLDLGTYIPGEVMALYEIGGALAAEVLTHVLRHSASVAPSLNYFIGRPPVLTAGDPWGVEGSPWGVEGSPWGVEGSPGTGGLPAAHNHFLTQWALGPQGIQLLDGTGNRMTNHVGTGVCVGIFDTSPFSSGDVTIDWAPSPLALHVEHPQVFYQVPTPPGAPDISDHGLFAAGLVYAVAPAGTIYLIRVLDAYGQGDAFTLAAAVLDWTDRMANPPTGSPPTGAVVNLSLGIPLDAPMLIAGQALENCVSVISKMIATRGILVAAAAGNDSWALPVSQLKPAQLPARDERVVGVQASHIGGGRACFSNLGDIAAPGCGLLSLAVPNPADNPFGYAYWSGTSFATALVSGLAALLSEVINWDPGPVAAALQQTATTSADATLPGGIAKLPAGL